MRRSEIPAFLMDPVQRAALSAELHTMADDVDHPEDQYDQERAPTRLERARAARLRTWATEVEEFGS